MIWSVYLVFPILPILMLIHPLSPDEAYGHETLSEFPTENLKLKLRMYFVHFLGTERRSLILGPLPRLFRLFTRTP